MKTLRTLSLLILLCGTAYADPVMVGGGTATLSPPIGVANWDASGLRIHFTVTNTSVEPLIITQLTNIVTGLWAAANLAIAVGDSQSFIRELNGVWTWVPSEFLDGTTVYFGTTGYSAPPATPTPEPATLGLLGAGLVALWRRRRSRGAAERGER